MSRALRLTKHLHSKVISQNKEAKILESGNWDEKFFSQVTEMVLRLSKEPSVKGMSRHLVLYGEKV